MPRRIIIWGYTVYGRLLDRLPTRAASHVERHRTRLLQRADYRGGAPWILFRTRAAAAPHRMVWRDIARFPTAVLLDATHAQDAIPINSCYVAPFPDRQSGLAATAVTNSSWSAALATVLADEARGGYRRFNARVIGSLPTVTSPALRSQLADLSTNAHDSNSLSQRDLDDAVAHALALPQSVQARLCSLVRRDPR